MQYLLIDKKDTITSIARIIGQNHIDALLVENGLPRVPKIGLEWEKKCDNLVENTPNDVTPARKATLLNSLTGSEEVFEKACLMDEDEWKVFSAFQAFRDALRIPETVRLPYSVKVIGDVLGDVVKAEIGNAIKVTTREPVSSKTYKAVMKSLKVNGRVDPVIFNSVNTSPPTKLDDTTVVKAKAPQYSYSLPWGKIQMYSTLLKETIDFPAYPEEIETSRAASYTAMPDIIYQYEPWIVYQSSGPREQTLNFHFHRDMWTGNHLDGKANELIRFCEANTFPDYNGSSVIAPYIRLYIDGSLFVSGVITVTTVNWSGPLGLDNWYLDFTLSLSIQEISEVELNVKSVKKLGLKGI